MSMALLSPTTCELKHFQQKEIASKFPFLSLFVCLVPQSCLSLCNPMDCSPPGSSVHDPMGFPKQEYWNGLPFPSPEDLSSPGIKTASPALAGEFFTTEPPGKPVYIHAFHFSLVQFSHSVVSNSLQPHEPQHARPPCPSATPKLHPNPCPSNW